MQSPSALGILLIAVGPGSLASRMSFDDDDDDDDDDDEVMRNVLRCQLTY